MRVTGIKAAHFCTQRDPFSGGGQPECRTGRKAPSPVHPAPRCWAHTDAVHHVELPVALHSCNRVSQVFLMSLTQIKIAVVFPFII